MFEEITQADLVNKGVEGLPDTPNLETAEMQRKFDEITKEVIVPKFNALIQKLNNDLGSDIKMIDPKDDTSKTLSALIGEIEDEVGLNTADRHNHANKALLDSLTAILFEAYNRLVTMLAGVNSVTDVVTNDTTVIPSGKAIVDFVQQMGGGDMLKEVYDTDNDGVVDNADALNGHPDTYFATVTALQALGSLITALQSLVLAVGTSESTPADTWTALQALKGQNIARLQMNALGDAKIFKSADGGSTWDGGSPVGGDKSDLATIEPGTTATAPYAAGDHVVVNNVYHEVTAAIAIGDTFVEGTNIDVKTVGGEITALNQNLTKWSPLTDTLWVNVNGVWTDTHVKMWLNTTTLFTPEVGYNQALFGNVVTSQTHGSHAYAPTMNFTVNPTNLDYTTKSSNADNHSTDHASNAWYVHSNAVDLTRFSKLFIKGSLSSSSTSQYFQMEDSIVYFGIRNQNDQDTILWTSGNKQQGEIDLELDLTQYNDYYRFFVETYATPRNYGTMTTTALLTEVYFS